MGGNVATSVNTSVPSSPVRPIVPPAPAESVFAAKMANAIERADFERQTGAKLDADGFMVQLPARA